MAPAAAMMPPGPGLPDRTHELDRRRIERALATRRRYRWVTPRVLADDHGWRVVSPNCSRNIDPGGGEIDVALLHYAPAAGVWRLFYRDHAAARWSLAGESPRLAPLVDELARDPARRFWP